jgi:hypothetical protein
VRGELEQLISVAEKSFASGVRVAIATPPYQALRKLTQYVRTNLSVRDWSVTEISPDENGCRVAANGPSVQVVFRITPQFSADMLEECSAIVGQQAVFILPG